MHEAKFRWALECIRDAEIPNDLSASEFAEMVINSSVALDAIQEHRLHHVRPHPYGGTFPYARPICECDQYDGPEGA